MKTKLFLFQILFLYLLFSAEAKSSDINGGETDYIFIEKLNDTTDMYQNSKIVFNTTASQVSCGLWGSFYPNYSMKGVFIYIKIDNVQLEIAEVRNQSDNSLIQKNSNGVYMIENLDNRASSVMKNVIVAFKYTCKETNNNFLAKVKIYLVASSDTLLRFNSKGIPQLLNGNVNTIDSTITVLKYKPLRCQSNVVSDFEVKPLEIKTSCNNASRYDLRVESLDKGELSNFKVHLQLPKHLFYIKNSAEINIYNNNNQVPVIYGLKQTFSQDPVITDSILVWNFSQRAEPNGITTDSIDQKKYFIVSFLLISDSVYQEAASKGKVTAMNFNGDTLIKNIPSFTFSKAADTTYYYPVTASTHSQIISKTCEYDSTQLSAGTYMLPGLTYAWKVAGGTSFNVNSSELKVKQSGTYICTVSNACYPMATYTAYVTNDQRPFMNNNNYYICPGSKAYLGSFPDNGVTYTWSASKGLSDSTLANPIASPDVTTTYYVTVIDHKYNCTHIDSAIVKVSPPLANAGSDKAICIGDSTTIGTTSSEGTAYFWSTIPTGNFPIGSSSDPLVHPATTSRYVVSAYYLTGTYDNNNCRSYDTVTVKVIRLVANAGADISICNGSNVTIGSHPVEGLTYEWSPSASLSSSDIANPVSYTTTDKRYVLVVKDGNNCISNDSINVTVGNCLPVISAPVGNNQDTVLNSNKITVISSQQDKDIYCVYPNPTSGIFNIDIIGNQQVSYELIDPTGNMILHENNINDQSLDIRPFAAGIYYMNVINRGRSYQTKIIKN